MNRCEQTRTARGPRRGRMLAALVAAACTFGVTATTPGTANAGSGDFCSYCDLGSGAHSVGNFRGYFYETETWNSDGKGVGSCSGVGTSGGSYATVACHGDAGGYNEVYCTGCNGDREWWALMSNNSNHRYNSVFTGWEWYA